MYDNRLLYTVARNSLYIEARCYSVILSYNVICYRLIFYDWFFKSKMRNPSILLMVELMPRKTLIKSMLCHKFHKCHGFFLVWGEFVRRLYKHVKKRKIKNLKHFVTNQKPKIGKTAK